jgi:RHS repeat-associated protein
LNFTGQYEDTLSGLYDFLYREYSPVQGRWISPDPAGLAAVDPTNPQSWNRYAYALNSPVRYIDPTGLECVWDDGSFDSEDDAQTGSVGGCQGQGGTWVELGQNGNWSGQADAANAALVSSIQNGLIGSVKIIGLDGQSYSTFYNGAGQTTETITPDATTFFSYGQPVDGDVRIYGLMGHGADILAAAGQQASHDLGCAGMGWAVQGGSVAASGAVLSTGTKLGGATSGTSLASATARTIGVSVPSTPTPVGIPFTESFAWTSSSTLGGVLGRWLPYIGTAISAALFNHCVDQHP